MSAHFGRFVAYYRVSTDKQGESGLGLDAQRQAVMNYLNGGPWKLVAEHTEVESGKRNARPNSRRPWRPAGAIRPNSASPNSTACPAIWLSSPP